MIKAKYAKNMSFEPGLPFRYHKNVLKAPHIVSGIADWHEAIELQFCLEGEGHIIMDSDAVALSKGDTAIVSPNVIHDTYSDSLITYDCLIINPGFCALIGLETSGLIFERVTASKGLWEIFERFRSIYNDTEDICRSAKLYGCITELLIYLRENHTLKENPQASNNKHHETVKRAIAYIRDNYQDKLTLDEISKKVYVGKYTLSREFKNMTGHTVIEYVNFYRCKCAASFISSGMAVAQAAEICGFNNMSFFTKMFRRHMKCLPSKLKEQ